MFRSAKRSIRSSPRTSANHRTQQDLPDQSTHLTTDLQVDGVRFAVTGMCPQHAQASYGPHPPRIRLHPNARLETANGLGVLCAHARHPIFDVTQQVSKRLQLMWKFKHLRLAIFFSCRRCQFVAGRGFLEPGSVHPQFPTPGHRCSPRTACTPSGIVAAISASYLRLRATEGTEGRWGGDAGS